LHQHFTNSKSLAMYTPQMFLSNSPNLNKNSKDNLLSSFPKAW
jgi:hypothetical protein